MYEIRKAFFGTMSFLLCVIILWLAAAAPYFYCDEEGWQDSKDRNAFAGEINVLMCGASHGYRAFVPVIFDSRCCGSSYNLGCSFMTMHGRYDMLKKELARNSVDIVIVELSYDSLTRNRNYEGPEGDIYQLGRCGSIREAAKYFFSAVRVKEYPQVCYHVLNRGLSGWKAILTGDPALKREPTKVWGNFAPKDMSLDADEALRLYDARKDSKISNTVFPENVQYLEACFELIRENGARAVIVVTPLPNRYLLGNSGFDVPLAWYRDYAEKYGCEFYDMNLLRSRTESFPEDASYSDLWHLSESGARTFTLKLCELMNAAEDGANTDGLFYGSYTEAVEAAVSEYRRAN